MNVATSIWRTPPLCIHCDRPAELTAGNGHTIWLCQCGALVGCHKGTTTPLGRPARKRTRKLRREVYCLLAEIWGRAWIHGAEQIFPKRTDYMAKATTYDYLAHLLQIDRAECHICLFDEKRCREAIEALAGRSFADVRIWWLAKEKEAKNEHANDTGKSIVGNRRAISATDECA